MNHSIIFDDIIFLIF